MTKDDVESRHRSARLYQGFLNELLFAEYLRSLHWRITDMEVWNEGPDIEAVDPRGTEYAIEVKFIGEDDESFLSDGGAFTLEKRSDYLLLRIFEAAHQLRDTNPGKKRMAVIILGNTTSDLFEMAILHNKVPWSAPAFHHREDDWKEFYRSEIQPKYPSIETELAPTIRSVDYLWILMLGDHFDYDAALMLSIGSNP